MRCLAIAFLVAFVFVAIVTGAPAAGLLPYTWTVSASSTDPFVHTNVPAFGLLDLWIWWVGPEDFSGTSFHFEASPNILLLAVSPLNGFLNTAAPTECPIFVVGGCPPGPIAAAHLLAFDVSGLGGTVCPIPCAAYGGFSCSFDCELAPELHPNSFVGFANDGSAPCQWTESLCEPISTRPTTWGRTKSLYR